MYYTTAHTEAQDHLEFAEGIPDGHLCLLAGDGRFCLPLVLFGSETGAGGAGAPPRPCRR